MCLLVLAWHAHPRYRLVVAANRDEFHDRPAAPLERWAPPDDFIVGGRDLRASGTWLAMDAAGRFGAVTNFREPQRPRPDAPSRGNLIPQYLRSGAGPGRFLDDLAPTASGYAGFNLLLADLSSLWFASNRPSSRGESSHQGAISFARPLPPGIYGLSNGHLDTPWPKLLRVRAGFQAWLEEDGKAGPDGLFALLGDRMQATRQHDLPLTGVDPEWEQVLSAPFVVHPAYGTRCSTVVLLESAGAPYIAERRFDRRGELAGTHELRL